MCEYIHQYMYVCIYIYIYCVYTYASTSIQAVILVCAKEVPQSPDYLGFATFWHSQRMIPKTYVDCRGIVVTFLGNKVPHKQCCQSWRS